MAAIQAYAKIGDQHYLVSGDAATMLQHYQDLVDRASQSHTKSGCFAFTATVAVTIGCVASCFKITIPCWVMGLIGTNASTGACMLTETEAWAKEVNRLAVDCQTAIQKNQCPLVSADSIDDQIPLVKILPLT